MRRIRNQHIHTNNPAVMFAQGLESLISDSLYSPSSHDHHDLGEMRRAANKPEPRGNLFTC